MNALHLLGRLTADPELRQTPNGNNVARFRIAVPRNKDTTNFFNITAWDKTAEFVYNNFTKGDRIIIHGSIHNADYVDKDGKKQYSVDILADRLEFADTKASKEAQKTAQPPQPPQQPPQQYPPNQPQPQQYPQQYPPNQPQPQQYPQYPQYNQQNNEEIF